MSKIATQLCKLSESDAQAQAEKLAIAIDQIWDGDGYTKYTFDDNSVLIQSGPTQFGLDADSEESIHAYAAWLGKDVKYEQAEIDRLIEAI